ncbi:MAG: DUF3667 domain-containing protein [Betaproteobacteria bacterium]
MPVIHGTASCVNCGQQARPGQGRYCTCCGEAFAGHRPSLTHWFHEFFEHTLSWDGRLAKSLWSAMRRPGEMANAYLAGKRGGFSKPLGLFLFVALASLLLFDVGVKYRLEKRIAEMQADYPVAYQKWLNTPRGTFQANQDLPAFVNDQAKKYWDRTVALTAPQAWLDGAYTRSRLGYFFTLLNLPIIAVLLKIIFWRRKKYIGEHLVVATYFYCVTFPLMLGILFMSMTQVIGTAYLAWSIMGMYSLLLLDTINTVYGGRPWVNFVRALMVVVMITYVLPWITQWLAPAYILLRG